MGPVKDHITTKGCLLSPETLAAKLGTSIKYARSLMANGTLPKIRLGRRCVRTTTEAVDAFIARRTIGTKGGQE